MPSPTKTSAKNAKSKSKIKGTGTKRVKFAFLSSPEFDPRRIVPSTILINGAAPDSTSMADVNRDHKKDLQAAGVRTVYDDTGAIGKLYRRQDEIGTPFCITIDFESLQDHAVTVRERDAMTQERVALDQVESYLAARLIGC